MNRNEYHQIKKMTLEIMKEVLEELDIEQSNPDQMLDVKDVARSLKMGESTVRKLIRDGKLDHYRLSGSIKVSREQLRDFLESNKVTQ